MKIGIVTFQRTDNYGAVLQAFALQSFLSAQGHEVEQLDYWPHAPASWIRRWLAVHPRNVLLKWQVRGIERRFARFRTQRLRLTKPLVKDPADLNSLSGLHDLLIAGSDQIWNPTWINRIPGGDRFFLLAFASPATRKISYAASFGHATVNAIPAGWQNIFRLELSAFDWISVRETSGAGLVKALCGREDAVTVVDPTLLMPASFYTAMMPPPARTADYLFSFLLHEENPNALRYIEQAIRATGLRSRSCHLHAALLARPDNQPPSPEHWLARIRDASLVITNSFHAVVFCLLFHTPFVALKVGGTIAGMNDRITNLLDMAGLSGRLCNANETFHPEGFSVIDWSDVDTRIAARRNETLCRLAGVDGLLARPRTQ